MSYTRDDRKGAHRANYERNRKRIFATQNTCGICGHPTFLANRYKNVKHKKGRVIHNLRAIV